MQQLDVLITPADFEALKSRDLSAATCVVFDVLRATSSMVTALAAGATGILPVADISDALAVRAEDPGVLLAGERHGLRIKADLAGGVEFDLGNSPREFTAEKVRGKRIAMTTTNGTRAIRACAGAREVFVAAFLNLGATEARLRATAPSVLLLVCGGTYEEAAYEDTLCAGALAAALWPLYSTGRISDSALMARRLFELEAGNLPAALASSRNGRRIAAHPELHPDLPYCSQRDVVDLVVKVAPGGWVQPRGFTPPQ